MSTLLLSNLTSAWAGEVSFTSQLLDFINAQPKVQMLLAEKSKTSQCGAFGEIASMSKSHLIEVVQNLPADDNSKEAQQFRENLKYFPEQYKELFFAQSECGGMTTGQNGVSVAVGQKADGTFELLQAVSY